MPLIHKYKKKFKGVNLKSGHFYKFKYSPYENDNKPLIIFMSWIEGIHESGHQWRLFQGLNMHYIPRSMRKRFIKIWMKELDKPGNIKFTWQKILARYPYIKMGIRRYMYSPAYYINSLEEIPLDRIEKEVVSSITKDFSGKIKRKILSRFKKMFIGSRKKKNKKILRR